MSGEIQAEEPVGSENWRMCPQCGEHSRGMSECVLGNETSDVRGKLTVFSRIALL